MLNGLDLFSGIGGLTLALAPWVCPVAYCESDRYAQAVLLSRMAQGELSNAPIWDDVRTLQGNSLPKVDCIYGGFPCQPYSSAARGRNPKDTLRKEFARLCNEIRPAVIFAGNTSAAALFGLADLLVRYKTEVLSNSAAEVGRPFIGKRYWMVAQANGNSKSDIKIHDEVGIMQTPKDIIWDDSPESIRMDDGLPNRMDRLRGLGNAVVPLQAREAFKRLMGLDRYNWKTEAK